MDTGLVYANARYYNSAIGRFISQDPLFWDMPGEYLIDPQQWNSYSYARNNPINRLDPTGLLNIIIPGTWYDPNVWSKDADAADLYNNVKNTFSSGKNTMIFNIKSLWSGDDNKQAREDAANNIAKIINNRQFSEGETLNIVGHSHGGNVAALLSFKLNRKIDNLVTLGTPIRADYQFSEGNINKHINVYSNFDMIQRFGGGMFSVPSVVLGCFTFCKNAGGFLEWGEFGPALRKYSGVDNARATKQVTNLPVSSHSELWKNNSVWEKVNRVLK